MSRVNIALGNYNEVQEDLFKRIYNNTIICHVANDLGGWGAGFVIPLARKYPYSREYYLKVHDEIGLVLGTTQFVEVDKIRQIFVANMIAQTLGGKRPLYYNQLARCMENVAEFCLAQQPESKIVCPKFGSALAGGDWSFIKELIHDCWIRRGIDVEVCYL